VRIARDEKRCSGRFASLVRPEFRCTPTLRDRTLLRSSTQREGPTLIFPIAVTRAEKRRPAAADRYTYRTVAGIASSSERLGCHGSLSAVMFSMDLSRLRGMMARVMKVAFSHVSVMASLLVIPLIVMPGRFLMVVRGFLVVICRTAMMFGRFLRHVGFLLKEN